MVKLNDYEINATSYPNGESCIALNKSLLNGNGNEIYVRFESDLDLMLLRFVKDFVDEHCKFGTPTTLTIPYLPYSRMDRQDKESHRLFTLRSVAAMINDMKFANVIVWEPHSDVMTGLLNRVITEDISVQLALIAMRDVLGLGGCCWLEKAKPEMYEKAKAAGIYLIYPDSGAEKRYRDQLHYSKFLTGDKHRDFESSHIGSMVIHGMENATDCKTAIIVDDLCSRGGTFIEAATAIRKTIPVEQVILAVTHCENNVFTGTLPTGTEIDKVYTTNSILRIHNYEDSQTNKFQIYDFKGDAFYAKTFGCR